MLVGEQAHRVKVRRFHRRNDTGAHPRLTRSQTHCVAVGGELRGRNSVVTIALVALLVLGPNKLPKLARDVGRWAGRARGTCSTSCPAAATHCVACSP
jgi:hypothetical protein